MKLRTSNRIKRFVVFAMLLLLAPAAQPVFDYGHFSGKRILNEVRGVASKGTPEEMIVAAIDAIREGRSNDASATIDLLLEKVPNYRLAHLLRADLYAMRAMPLQTMGGGAKGPADQLEDLRREAQVRIQRHLQPPPSNAYPANILVFSPKQRYAIAVDTSVSRLYVFANDEGKPKLVHDTYVTIGKLGAQKMREGDQRTPLGVYFITRHMARAELDKTYGNLADLYGIGAWPISYPNEWDKKEGRTGYGIWLHGSPEQTYARAPQASNGCVVLTNQDMQAIAPYLQIGVTPVVIAAKINWLTEQAWQAEHNTALQTVELWRTDWEKLDTDKYLQHYSTQFQSDDGTTLQNWKAQKLAINNSKEWVKITLDDLSIFATGGEKNLMVSSFKQNYKSSNLSNQMNKRLYWQQSDAGWHILWEGAANTAI